jgi:Peptidase family M28
MLRAWPCLLVLLSCAAPSVAAPAAAPVAPVPVVAPAPEPPAPDPAVERLVEAHLQFLASDDLGGRETGTVQGLVTGQYVASALREAGLEPAGEDGGFFQKYPLERNRLEKEAARLELLAASGGGELKLGDDWALRGFTSTGFDLQAEVVFAGHGLVSEEQKLDEFAGLDVAGRFVAVLDGPRGRDSLRPVANWRAKREAARERGALGLITLYDEAGGSGRSSFTEMVEAIDNPSMSPPPAAEEAPRAWPVLGLKSEAGARLFAAAGLDLVAERAAHQLPAADDKDASPFAPPPGRALPGVTLHLVAPVESERTHGYNVVARLPGSDPALAHEYVLVTAHMDHIGILRDGRVNNGADDNASGTTTLLVAAEELAQRPAPKRSIVFLSVSGEEKGLLGSEWWVEHPTLPLADAVADINVDMVGRNDPDAVGATPSPEHEDYNSLVERAVEIAPQAGLRVTWTAPEAGKDKVDNYYHRSDHYNFAEKGIPVVFFFSGLHDDYHKPTDDLEKIDRLKVARMVDFVGRLATDVANAPNRPHKLAGGEGR